MANPQIEQLRAQFNGYNNAQKKQFIDNLRAKLQGKNNAEYSQFLNECIQKYNAAIRGGSTVGVGTTKSIANAQSKNVSTAALPKKGNKKKKFLLAVPIVAVAVVIVAILVSVATNQGNDDRLLGVWRDDVWQEQYLFMENGIIIFTMGAIGDVTIFYGTWSLSGNNLTIHYDSSTRMRPGRANEYWRGSATHERIINISGNELTMTNAQGGSRRTLLRASD